METDNEFIIEYNNISLLHKWLIQMILLLTCEVNEGGVEVQW